MPQNLPLENLLKSNPVLSPKINIYLPANSAEKKPVNDNGPAEIKTDRNDGPVAKGYSYQATNHATGPAHALRPPRFSNSKFGHVGATSQKDTNELSSSFGSLALDGLPSMEMKKNAKFLSTYSRNIAESELKTETSWLTTK